MSAIPPARAKPYESVNVATTLSESISVPSALKNWTTVVAPTFSAKNDWNPTCDNLRYQRGKERREGALTITVRIGTPQQSAGNKIVGAVVKADIQILIRSAHLQRQGI